MARVPLNAYGQSRYTDQLLQTVLIPTVVTNSVNGDDFYTIETDISTSTLHADTVYAGTVNTSIIGLGDLATKTLALGSQSLQGDYTSRTDTTVIGVRAAGNDNFRGTFDGNVLIGAETGLNLCNTNYSTYIGATSGTFGQATSNVVVGYGACVGVSGTPTVGNVILGAGAGLSNTGNSNVFIGLNAGADLTVSNTLIVHNTSSSINPLLYGKFDSRQLGINCVPTRNFQVSGSTLLNGDLTVSGNIDIAGSLSGLTTLGINCVPTATLQVSGSTILKNLSASNVLTRTLGVNYVPTIDTVSGGSTFGVAGNSFFDGDLTVLGTITGAVAPTGISGFAADLHGGGHGYYGGVCLSDSSITLSGNISNLSSTTNYIGGVYLLNSNVSLGGNISNVSSSTNFIGGVYLRNSNISFDGTITTITANANRIGDVYLVNGDISFGLTTGKITTFSNASNFIGGIVLSNRMIDISDTNTRLILSNGAILGKVKVTLPFGPPLMVDIFSISAQNGGSISNQFSSWNNIGGVHLRDCNISLGLNGTITTFSNTSNCIGGVTLSSGNVILDGAGSFSNNDYFSVNRIGGVSISNFKIRADSIVADGYINSNNIGGITLQSRSISGLCNITGDGQITMSSGLKHTIGGVEITGDVLSAGALFSLSSSSNNIGGITLCNRSIITDTSIGSRIGGVHLLSNSISLVPSGTITTFSDTSNRIGGVTLSGGSIDIAPFPGSFVSPTLTLSYLSTKTTLDSLGLIITSGATDYIELNTGKVWATQGFRGEGAGGLFSNICNTCNTIGGVELYYGKIFNSNSSSNYIGGVHLLSNNISLDPSGTITTFSNTSNRIGGVTLSGGVISNISSTSNYIGGVHLLSNSISLVPSGTITTFSDTSNRIGGVTLSGSLLSCDRIGAGSATIAGTTLSLDGIRCPFAIIGNDPGSENRIGGVFLQNSNISFDGRITNLSNTSNRIGGVFLLSNNISLGSSGAITTFSNTSNYIGGVHLLSNTISLGLSGSITTFSNTSNRIGGIRLNSGILSTGDGVNKCMIVGDQFLQVVGDNGCNRFVFDSSGSEFRACNATPFGTFSLDSLTGRISNASNSSNTIGGITLNNRVIGNLVATTVFSNDFTSTDLIREAQFTLNSGVYFCYATGGFDTMSAVIDALGTEARGGGISPSGSLRIRALPGSKVVRFSVNATGILLQSRIYSYFGVAP